MAGWLMSRLCMRCCGDDTPFGVCFWFTWSLFSCSRLAVRPFGGRFRHAEESLCFQRFPVVSACPGCVDRRCAVGLSLAAQHGGLASGDWGGLLVWWWFENSRAYLYYFFIVNDCQSVLRPARVFRVWVPGGRSNGTGFLRTVRFPDKRMSIFLFESHMLVLFMKGFLWRVRFWLRMNAGGVLNTCKSNGIHQALLGGESGERVSNA